MEDPLGVGVVGTGYWGTHDAAQFEEHEDAEVVALADVAAGSRERAGRVLGVEPAARYDDHEAMFDAEQLDAVQISSPHAFHYEQTVAALERGLHVLCEKPFVPDVEQAAELARRAEAGDQVVMVGYQRHVHPAYAALREAIADGELTPSFVTAELSQNWLERVAGTWRVDPALSGGGQLYDSGSHLLDALVWTLGRRPERVGAEMAYHDDARRVDVQASLSVRFEGDVVATVAVSGDAPDVYERLAVRGVAGRAVIEGAGWRHRELSVTDPLGKEVAAAADDLSTYDKVDAFVRAVRDGIPPPATARDAFHATALTEAAYEAARTGRRTGVRSGP